ncbi:hypothetical protein [Fructobacillus parabroussonetiae]|uniref:Phage shock protein A n=1 Tax=Fructobacillus parabroussonetiae TaxID=2713174 RepID=A0ABS5QW99_9LACO|nr:hypothetical protein [Fructobacillus parabroussonetiae]MBS9337410.1 hypothetical protein [Fructobacillus parabroussonetiae]
MAFNKIKSGVARLKEINALQKQAKEQSQVLQRAIDENQKDLEEVKRDIKRYQFKMQAPLNRIQETLSTMKK